MSKSDLKALGSLITKERTNREMTQRDLAAASGVGLSTVFHLEQGDFKRPDPDKLQRIATALELDVEDFFTLAGYTPQDGLPSLGPYLRKKYEDELSATNRKKLERYFEELRKDDDSGRRRRGSAR
jgi:transcriptional regulator with XRE-family HTH domain